MSFCPLKPYIYITSFSKGMKGAQVKVTLFSYIRVTKYMPKYGGLELLTIQDRRRFKNSLKNNLSSYL